MQKIVEKQICSGCHACFNACRANAITMARDDDGFLYPHIDERRCLSCNQCRVACPILHAQESDEKGKAYACINKNEDIRLHSSSGGIFTLLAEYVLERDGVVFGAAFDENFDVQHIYVETPAELYKLRGSKYVQSKIGTAYKTAKDFLAKGRYVLFSGTPCQTAGLRSYLGKEYDNLLVQDIICHGVPSPLVWQRYVAFREKKTDSKTKAVSFRMKNGGWNDYSMQYVLVDDTVYEETHEKDLFMQAFIRNLCLRPSCYNCHFKSLQRGSDITLADFWGAEHVCPDMFDNKGTSLVFVNSEKGRQIFKKLQGEMRVEAVDIEKATVYNTAAVQSAYRPLQRERFMQLIKKTAFDKALQKSTQRSTLFKIALKLKKTILKIGGRKNV